MRQLINTQAVSRGWAGRDVLRDDVQIRAELGQRFDRAMGCEGCGCVVEGDYGQEAEYAREAQRGAQAGE